jgi:hypothetical protein
MNNEEKILAILTTVQADISGLKEGQASMQADISGLKEGQAKLEIGQASMQADIASLKEGQTKLEIGQAKLEAGQIKLEAGQAETNNRLDGLETDINLIQATQGQHTFLLKQIARYVKLQTSSTVSLDERVTELERRAGII